MTTLELVRDRPAPDGTTATDSRPVTGAVHRPGWLSLVCGMALSLLVVHLTNLDGEHPGPLSWYVTVVWSLPLAVTVQGLAGAWVVRRHTRTSPSMPPRTAVRAEGLLIVVVPTIGRHDTLPGLARVAASLSQRLPQHFATVRLDVVTEERCPARAEIEVLCARLPGVRLVVVPEHYRTPHGSRFKARANQFALDRRTEEGESLDDVWVLHMDDDTAVSEAAAAQLADFVRRQSHAVQGARHLAQGVLAYPREYSPNRLTWYADAIRPGCDMSFFAVTTGRGSPRAGLHGELLCVRASVEAQIGWDFGPDSLVEDAQFALLFSELHPGGSEWFSGWCEGASPRTVRDFVRQRERWVWGLMRLVIDRSVPLRRRLELLPNVAVWVLAPFGHPLPVAALALLLGDPKSDPALALAGAVWSLNYGFFFWLYWEGFQVNCLASGESRHRWSEGVFVVALMPLSCLLECLGIVCGAVRFFTRRRTHFTVIGKPS